MRGSRLSLHDYNILKGDVEFVYSTVFMQMIPSTGFIDMAYLFSCGARNIIPKMDHDVDSDIIRRLARSQGVWDTTFLAMKRLNDNGALAIDKGIFTQWQQEIVIHVISASRRKEAVYDVITQLERNGISCCVLKGEVIASLYHDPNCRISSDTDLLVDKSQEKKAFRMLEYCGFKMTPRNIVSHHAEGIHPIAGMLDLHTHLYDDLIEDVWFDNIVDYNEKEFITIDTNDRKKLTTLGIDDGLAFIALHNIKHFLEKGAGIRQLVDMLLYMVHYKEMIDWERFYKIMNHLKFTYFIECLIGIGIEYLCFNPEELPKCVYKKDILPRIMLDIETGGVYGKDDKARDEFYKVYNKERFSRYKKDKYEKYMNNWNLLLLIQVLFPKKLILEREYKCKINVLFLPFVWSYRLIVLFFRVKIKKKNITQYLLYSIPSDDDGIKESRMELIRELGMI